MTVPPDDPLDRILWRVGILLRVGVLTAAAILAVGGAVFLLRHGSEPRKEFYQHLRKGPDQEEVQKTRTRPIDVFRAVRAGRGRAIVQLGLMVLIATPVLRVAYTAGAFARRRDFVYVLVPLIVLAVLIAGLVSGQAG